MPKIEEDEYVSINGRVGIWRTYHPHAATIFDHLML
jgi:hypothetical protein